jgi:hypothetical protein
MAPGTGNGTTTQGAPNMSSNRLRLLLVTVMAVFAISAVASASASAAATCYPVAEKETGNFASSERCEKKEETTKGEWVAIEKLEKEVSPGVWCAKVKVAKTGTFKNAGCTEAEAKGTFIKVKVSLDEWEVCEEAAGEGKEPPTKYDEHKCTTKAKALALRKWQWSVLGAGVTKKVKSSGGTFTLTAGGKVITCTAVTDKGTITGGKPGTDLAENITFTGCTTKQAGCEVKSAGGTLGTIVVPNIPTKLEQRVVGEEEVVVDNFEQNATTKEFVTLEFSGASCAGAGYVTTKVKGTVAAEVVPGTAELNFPATALEKDTLEAFGLKATLTGKDTQELENEWAFRAGEGPPPPARKA